MISDWSTKSMDPYNDVVDDDGHDEINCENLEWNPRFLIR